MSTSVPKISQIKDAKLLKALLAFAKKDHSDENVLFIVAAQKDGAEKLYKNFISTDAKTQVNLSGKLLKAAEMLAGHIDMKTGQPVPPKLRKPDWKSAGWKTVIDMAVAEVESMFHKDVTPRFMKSQEYLDYVGVDPKKAMPQVGDINKAAKLLGISDVKKLKAAMDARALGKVKDAEKLMDQILKEEKMQMRSAQIFKDLEKAGLV